MKTITKLKKERWLLSHDVIRNMNDSEPGKQGYWVRLITEGCMTPGSPWEVLSFSFMAPVGNGAKIVRRVLNNCGPMTSVEVFERVSCLGDADFAQLLAADRNEGC